MSKGTMLSTIARSQIAARRTALNPLSIRTYADTNTNNNKPTRGSTTRGEPGPSTNIRPSPSSSQEASEINTSRSKDGPGEASPSTAQPISNPEQGGMGIQEEPQPSQEKMKRPPSEPDHVKRQHVEKMGEKKLDPADEGFQARQK